MIFPRIQLSVSGVLGQVFAYLVEMIRTKIEVFRARNTNPGTLLKGTIVTLYNNGANVPRAVRETVMPADFDYAGVLEQDIAPGDEGICRFDNEVYVRIVNGDVNVANGNFVYASATPGVGAVILFPSPFDVLVGEIVDASGYNPAAPTGTTGAKVLLRYCCVEQQLG